MGRPFRSWQSLVFAALAALLSPTPGSACDPATDCSGGVDLGLDLPAPFPDTGDDWLHASGSSFHCNRDCWALDINYNLDDFHNLDYWMPVLAVADGEVEDVTYGAVAGSYGNRLMIDHGTFHTLYAHLDEVLLVTLGQQVRAGQVIGFISDSGADFHHLHFALRNSDDTSAAYCDLNGRSLAGANASDIYDLSSASDQFFEDELEAQNSGWNTAAFALAGGIATLPAVDQEIEYKHSFHVRDGKGPYVFEYAIQTEPLASSGVFALQLRAFDFGNHPNRTADEGEDRELLGYRWTWDPTADTRQGWEVYSDVFEHGDFPAGTRFVQPVLQTWASFGGAKLDWIRFREGAPAAGGDVRLQAYNRGGATQLVWSLSQPGSGETGFLVLRATAKEGPYTLVDALTATGDWLYVFADAPVTWGERYYYKLAIQADEQRVIGPLGPVETYVLHDVPDLGRSRIYSDMAAIPDWADYPGSSFDGDPDTYGFINYSPDPVTIVVAPESVPFAVSSVDAYFGGNTNDWEGSIVEFGTNSVYSLGATSNDWLEWSSLPGPGRAILSIRLGFQRTNWDFFFHNAELRFVP